MKHFLHLPTKALIAVLLMAIMPPLAHAASTFSVRYLNGKFDVTRSDTVGSETVLYRTVSMTALAGVHFTPASGSLTFNNGDKTLTVEVSENSNVAAIYRYQSTQTRSYVLEVLDLNGYFLAKGTRVISYGSGSVVTKDKFTEVKSYSLGSSEFKVTDKGYKQGYHAIPVTSFFNTNVPREYMAATNAYLSLLVEFEACEVDDGYQYVQILINNESTCDEGAGDGDPGPTDLSVYKAGFTHEGGKKNTNYKKYGFPSVDDYNYNYETDDIGGRPNRAWLKEEYDNNDIGRLMKQFFKAVGTDYYYYRDSNGWLELRLDGLNTVGIRFDASGNLDDDWKVRNLVAKVMARDGYSHLASAGIVVSPGPYKKGNTFYVSIPVDRIISLDGDQPVLHTTWGNLNYLTGSGSNVMTFEGVITAPAGTTLTIDSYTGSMRALGGSLLRIESTTFGNCVVSEDYTLDHNTVITNLFDEPILDNGVNKPRPFAVSWRNKALTEGTDYTVGYADNRGPESGTKDATVVITGMGQYSGSVMGTFSILAVALSDFNEIETGVYEIANREDLMHLSAYVSNGMHDCQGLTFRQTHDIADVGEFCPIGGPSRTNSKFKGHYDGQGFTISGINVYNDQDPNRSGLFGLIESSGVVENIVLANSAISGSVSVGAIAGECHNGDIKNCLVGGDVTINPMQGVTCNQHGGIAGNSNYARIEGCVSAAVVNAQMYAGGIAGEGSSGQVKHNLYTGTSVVSGQNVGAIVGHYWNSYTPSFTNNYYLDSNQPGGVMGADVDGARFARTITLGENVFIKDEAVEYGVSGLTAFGSIALMSDSVIYSSQGNTITLDYDAGGIDVETAEGYEITYYVNGTSIAGNTFTMPDGDVTVTATVTRHRYTFNSATGELRLIWGEFNRSYVVGSEVDRKNVLSITASDEVSFTGDCSYLFWAYENCQSMDFSQVNTNGLTGMRCMFDRCKKLESINVTGWNTADVTDMQEVFTECSHLTTINGISDWDTGNVTNMKGMFNYCSSIDSLDLSRWNIGNLENVYQMFFYAAHLTDVDLSGWNTGKVKNMTCMFQGCSRLTTIHTGDGWITDSVTTMNNMFYFCEQLTALDATRWNTGNVTTMANMFRECRAITAIDGISGWDTGNVTDMSRMFDYCYHLPSLDLSGWNTGNVENMSNMFIYCVALTTIYAGEGWNTDRVTDSEAMFNGCRLLKGGRGTAYDPAHIDKEYARIDGGESAPGYFTAAAGIPGDLNNDGVADVADVNILINVILERNNDPIVVAMADISGDGTIDISDVNALINIILAD